MVSRSGQREDPDVACELKGWCVHPQRPAEPPRGAGTGAAGSGAAGAASARSPGGPPRSGTGRRGPPGPVPSRTASAPMSPGHPKSSHHSVARSCALKRSIRPPLFVAYAREMIVTRAGSPTTPGFRPRLLNREPPPGSRAAEGLPRTVIGAVMACDVALSNAGASKFGGRACADIAAPSGSPSPQARAAARFGCKHPVGSPNVIGFQLVRDGRSARSVRPSACRQVRGPLRAEQSIGARQLRCEAVAALYVTRRRCAYGLIPRSCADLAALTMRTARGAVKLSLCCWPACSVAGRAGQVGREPVHIAAGPEAGEGAGQPRA